MSGQMKDELKWKFQERKSFGIKGFKDYLQFTCY